MKSMKGIYDEIIQMLLKIDNDVSNIKTGELSENEILLLKNELLPVLRTIEKDLLRTAILIEHNSKHLH